MMIQITPQPVPQFYNILPHSQQQQYHKVMQSLSEKQDYLSKQILDRGYDPEEFQDYMLHHSSKELDLNLWTVGELKGVVAKFKKFKERNGQDEGEEKEEEIQMDKAGTEKNKSSDNNEKNEQQRLHSQSMVTNQTENLPPSPTASTKSVNSSLYKHFSFAPKPVLPQLYILIHHQQKPFTIRISSYSKTTPNNIFKSSYIQYNIECSEGWRTKRRFTDFVWLQGYFRQAYEGMPVPPVPEKTTLRSFDDRHVAYRMMMFQRFLGVLVMMPEACSDPILEIFLRGSEQYFSQSKKRCQQKLDSNLGSTKLQSIFGNDLVLMDQHSIEPHTINFYRQYSTKLNNISSQLNILVQDMKKVQSDIFQLSSEFQDLQGLLNSGVKGAGFVGVMQDFCNSMGMYMAKNGQFVKSNVYSVWNYETMYINNLLASMNKIQKEKTHIGQKYKNAMIKIPEEGSQAFTNSLQPNKSIKQFQIVKQLYRIKLSYCVRQMHRYQETEMLILSKEWTAGLKKFIRDISQWMIGCTDNLTKSMSVGEGKNLIEVEYINNK